MLLIIKQVNTVGVRVNKHPIYSSTNLSYLLQALSSKQYICIKNIFSKLIYRNANVVMSHNNFLC